ATEHADYLPRVWARWEIDRLLAEDAGKHKEAIVNLSKNLYVMSPYTSLLVLENDDMYKQYKVERGRKEKWAWYATPQKIAVVKEGQLSGTGKPKSAKDVIETILMRDVQLSALTPHQRGPVVAKALPELGLISRNVPIERKFLNRFNTAEDTGDAN